MKNVTTKEAARRLHYSGDAQIRKLIQRAKLKAEKFGGVRVIAEEELEDLVTERIVPWWPHQKNRQRRKRSVYVRIELECRLVSEDR
jgi:hypothetical protein